MSEFKCAEPGCDYHVGISNGPNLTPEDWESEDYYFQEIEEHQQMHEEEQHEKIQRKAAMSFRRQLQERDKACRVCGGPFARDLKSMGAPAIMHLDPTAMGLECLARVHQVCVIDRSLLAGHPAVKRLLAQNRDMQSVVSIDGQEGSISKPKRDVGIVDDSFTMLVREDGVEVINLGISINRRRNRGRGFRGQGLVDVSRPDELHHHDLLLNFIQDVVSSPKVRVNLELHTLVDHMHSHQISLSVGAPNGAGIGTSDSTERGQTPDSPEMKEHPTLGLAEVGQIETSDASPVSYEQTLVEMSAAVKRLAALVGVLENGGPSFDGSHGQQSSGC